MNEKTGVLIINTGTPDAPTQEAIRRYLQEFLMDPAIIGAPKFIRKRIVNKIVAKRPEKTLNKYERFWTNECSPFMLTSQLQRRALEEKLLADTDKDLPVALGMRYGNPSIKSALEQLKDADCVRIVVVPLYPQNVNVCAGTCFKKVREELANFATRGWTPQVLELKSFCSQEAYLEALAQSAQEAWSYTPGSKLVVSFHSTMMADIKKDNTYVQETQFTARELAKHLNIPDEDVILSYQSRFDSRAWLSPFTEQEVKRLAAEGVRDICIICPGFVADNIETLIDIDVTLKDEVEQLSNGQTHLTYVPALGTNPLLIDALSNAICELLTHIG